MAEILAQESPRQHPRSSAGVRVDPWAQMYHKAIAPTVGFWQNPAMLIDNLARSEREDHRWRMLALTEKLADLKGGQSVASILERINATSLQEKEELLSRDWLTGLFNGRKSVDVWELRALARGFVPELMDPKEEARRRVDVYRQLVALAFPLDWSGADAI